MEEGIVKETIKDPRTGVTKVWHWVKPTTRTVIENGKKFYVGPQGYPIDYMEKKFPRKSNARADFQQDLL